MNTDTKTKIENAVGNGEIARAIKILRSDWQQNPLKRISALLISNRFSRLEKEKIKGTISASEYNAELNKIAESILRLCKSQRDKSNWIVLLFSAVIVVLAVLFLYLEMQQKDQVQYCLVSESFALYSNAESYLATIKEKSYPNASITISKNNFYLVCFDILNDQKEAIYQIERLKVKEGNHALRIQPIR